jgi:hypothetical protein
MPTVLPVGTSHPVSVLDVRSDGVDFGDFTNNCAERIALKDESLNGRKHGFGHVRATPARIGREQPHESVWRVRREFEQMMIV